MCVCLTLRIKLIGCTVCCCDEKFTCIISTHRRHGWVVENSLIFLLKKVKLLSVYCLELKEKWNLATGKRKVDLTYSNNLFMLNINFKESSPLSNILYDYACQTVRSDSTISSTVTWQSSDWQVVLFQLCYCETDTMQVCKLKSLSHLPRTVGQWYWCGVQTDLMRLVVANPHCIKIGLINVLQHIILQQISGKRSMGQ